MIDKTRTFRWLRNCGTIPVHPIAFAVYPVLFLWSRNADVTPPDVMLLPAAVSAGVATFAWLAFSWMLRSGQKAALVVAGLAVLFYTYGPLAALLPREHVDEWQFRLYCVLAFAWSLAALATIWWGRDLRRITVACNLVSLFLLVAPLAKLAEVSVTRPWAAAPADADHASWVPVIGIDPDGTGTGDGGVPAFPLDAWSARPDALPDVYHIIVDGYGRGDVLEEFYGVDNEPFLQALEHRGFSVARRSTSNYVSTHWSVPSTLNGDYLDDYIGHTDDLATELRGLLLHSLVARQFRQLGYTFITYESGATWMDIPTSDEFRVPPATLGEFSEVLLDMTPLSLFKRDSFLDGGAHHRNRIRFILDDLTRVAADPRPTYTMAHLISPHPPFVFGQDPSEVQTDGRTADGTDYLGAYGATQADYARRYANQLLALNEMLLETLDRIVRTSDRPPVLILHSDHGPKSMVVMGDPAQSNLRECFANLIAVSLPDRVEQPAISDDLSLVNLFRVVLNRQFGAELPMLEDRCFFGIDADPYRPEDVTGIVRSIVEGTDLP